MRKSLLVACLLSLLMAPAFAESVPKKSQGNEMESAKCGDILDLFAAADPKASKDKKALLAAQDKTYVFVMWVHGYLSGRDGVDFAKRPLNQAGITQVVQDIYQACSSDEKRDFLNAVKDIR